MSDDPLQTLYTYPGEAWIGRKACRETPALEACVTGPDRFKYFVSRPDNPVDYPEMQHLNEDDILERLKRLNKPKFSSVGTQTTYRESEAQTDPSYDPPYTMKDPNAKPMSLMVKSLHYGQGLPLTMDTQREIDYALARKEWEKTLPPLAVDETTMKRRHAMVVEQLKRDMEFKNNIIKREMELKTTLWNVATERHVQARKERVDTALDGLWVKKKDELSKKSDRVMTQLSREMKRLDKKKKSVFTRGGDDVEAENDEGNVAPFSKQSFSAPNLSFGRNNRAAPGADMASESVHLANIGALIELERWLWEEQKIVMEPEIFAPKWESHPTRLQRLIDEAQQELCTQKVPKTISARTDVRSVVEKRPPTLRPPTPTIHSVTQETLDRNCAFVVVQRLLRGRALQKELMEIRKSYVDLILELRETQALPEDGFLGLEERRKTKLASHAEAKKQMDQESVRDEILHRFEGTTLGDELNQIGRSISRFELSELLSSLVEQAKRERYQREAEEAGRRQLELMEQKITSEPGS